ncbi:MAG: uncharacterized protein H6Q89_1405, partial [Myxococcaceae bacterium]|nr:uncharacterized protein [Myxococcaceae bacterium]
TLLGFLSPFPAVAAEPAVAAGPVPVAVPAPALVEPPPKEELKLPIPDIELPKTQSPEAAPVEELNLGWTLIRTFVVLGFVIMAIYVTLNFGLRRLMGISAMPRGQAVVQVLERIPLDQKRAMFVVRAAGEYLLIGGGDGSLQLIAKLDPAEVEKLRVQPQPAIALSPFLLKLLKRRDVPAPPAPGDNS